MGKSTLVKSADQITKVSADSLKEYVDKMDFLVATMNEVMLKREDILELIGEEKNILAMKENHKYHFLFIASILETPDPEILVDTVLWVFRSYMSKGFRPSYWAVQINTWIQLLKENISENAFFEIYSIYNWLHVNIPIFAIAADEELEKSKHMEH